MSTIIERGEAIDGLLNRGPSVQRWSLRFPEKSRGTQQDEEIFEAREPGGEWTTFRLHDYAEIFRRPGLYEKLIYDHLQCRSPWRVAGLLRHVLDDWEMSMSDLRVLDLGAGNGIVGDHLRELGVKHLAAADILPEARLAAERDYPDAYEEYFVEDFTALPEEDRQRLRAFRFNALITVAALGFGDIPPRAYAEAFNAVSNDGWIALSIKETFLRPARDQSGFAAFMSRLIEDDIFELVAWQRHHHRLSIAGKPLFYVALVGRKRADVPLSLIEEREAADRALEAEQASAAHGTLLTGEPA